MKIKLISALFIILSIVVSWFTWSVYDYNYGQHAEINLSEYCVPFREGVHLMGFFQFKDCPVKELKKSNEKVEKYRIVAELAKIDEVSYFLGCQKEGDCSPRVFSESLSGSVNDNLRQSESIHDTNYKISPDKKRIVFLHTVNNINSLYLYNIEKQVGIDIQSDAILKKNETVACELGSYGMDSYSCGEWKNDSEYIYGVYERSKLLDQKFTLVRSETYIIK